MSLRPIDIKTNLVHMDDASKLRENQKAHEAGLAGNVAQNKNANDQKTDSVQKNENADGKVIRKEDEEAEKKQKEKEKAAKAAQKAKEEEEEKKRHPIPDGTRGLKIDFKA